MLYIVLAFIIVFIGWAIINLLLGIIPSDYIYIKLITTFTINIIYGMFMGRYIGRRLLYIYLKKIYKNKKITEE